MKDGKVYLKRRKKHCELTVVLHYFAEVSQWYVTDMDEDFGDSVFMCVKVIVHIHNNLWYMYFICYVTFSWPGLLSLGLFWKSDDIMWTGVYLSHVWPYPSNGHHQLQYWLATDFVTVSLNGGAKCYE